MVKSYLPPLKALQYFLAAAKLSSFKLAALELNVTQAAISQQIKILEDYFGFTLFIRKTRHTILNDQGKRLFPFIERGFGQLQEGVKMLSGDPKPNILRLSTINSFTSIWLLPQLHTFQEKYPNIMVQIAPSNELVDFDRGEIDLAIRMGTGKYKGLVSKKIVQDELVLIASPLLIESTQILNPEIIFALPWIEDTSFDISEVFDILCAQYGIEKSSMIPIIKSNHSVTIIENVIQGRGFALANKNLVSQQLDSGDLLALLNFTHKNSFAMHLVAPEQNFKWEKVKRFEDWFVKSIAASYG